MSSQATDKIPYSAPPGTTAEKVLKSRERILSVWGARLRKVSRPAEIEDEPILIDTYPALLENLAQALDEQYPRVLATEGTTIATEHGGERARLTRFAPQDVIREFQLLRDTILEVLSEDKPLSPRDRSIVIQSLDQALTESLTAYFLVHRGIHEQFVAILTHDLRNPLSAIRVTNDLMMRNPHKMEQLPIWTARIADSLRRVDRMIQDLLDASRVQYGEKIRFEVEEFDLFEMLERAVTQFATVHGDRFALIGESLKGFWNRSAFRRAVDNLLENAVKYGDPTQKITTRLEVLHGRVIVSVRNFGSYLPPEEQESLFKAFMRTQSAEKGKKRGWGLGLAMVRGMAEGHGGSITVDSSPERGTAFLIDVPVDSRPYLGHSTTPDA